MLIPPRSTRCRKSWYVSTRRRSIGWSVIANDGIGRHHTSRFVESQQMNDSSFVS